MRGFLTSTSSVHKMSNTLNILQHILFISRFGKKKKSRILDGFHLQDIFASFCWERANVAYVPILVIQTFLFRNTIFVDCTCDSEWNNLINKFTLFDEIYCRILQGVLLTIILFLSIVYIIARKICKERKFEQIEWMRDAVAVDQRVRVRTNRHFARKPVTTLKVTLLHWCFSRFLNCANGTKSRKVGNIIY